MEENVKDMINLSGNNELNSDEIIIAQLKGLYNNQLTEYANLQNKVNTIKDLLIYKHNLKTPNFQKINKYYYLNKRIKSSNFPKNKNLKQTFRNLSTKKTFINTKKKDSHPGFSLNNAVLKKIFNVKRIDTDSRFSIDSNKKNKQLNEISKKSISSYIYFKQGNSNNSSSHLNKLNKKSSIPDPWYKNYKYQFKNINLFKNNKKNMNNFNKINSYENSIFDFDQEDQSHKYEKFYLRGLTLSTEQNYYYKKCKEIDYLFYDKDEKNNDNKDSYNKTNMKPQMYNKSGKNKFIEKRNKISVKYCLRDLLNTGNPIKIKI